MKTLHFGFSVFILFCFSSDAVAQRAGPPRGGERGAGGLRAQGPGNARRMPPGMEQADQNGLNGAGINQQRRGLRNQQAGNGLGRQNEVGQQNMPSVQQLAQMMIANFDADRSGQLSQTELQNALGALRQMMMRNRGNAQNQAGAQAQITNQANTFGGRARLQGDQAAGNRRPRPGRGR